MPVTKARAGGDARMTSPSVTIRVAAALLAAFGSLGAAWGATTSTDAAAEAEPAGSPLAAHALVADLASRLFAELDRHRSQLARNPQGVVALVDPLLSPHFDSNHTARLALGAYWRTASDEQRQRFAVAFYRTLLSTYAEAIADWAPDRFRLLPRTDDAAALQVLVRTQVSPRNGAPARVDYRLRWTAEGWKIFDVLVDGVSYVHSYHADLDAEISRTGLEAAILRLERRADGALPPTPR